MRRSTSRVLAYLVPALAAAFSIGACTQSPGPAVTPTPSGAVAVVASTTVPVPGGCSIPRTGPADAVGCYLAGTESLGVAPASPLFWHIDAYATRAAAESARRAHGTVAEAHGRAWLFTIAEAEWRPDRGERVARVGPLPLTPGRTYAAHYIEGVVPPLARTPVHRHAGPEAWYVLEGAQCLETPDGVRVVRAGESLVIPEGPPMLLTGAGPSVRRVLTLVVHDAAQPWTIPTSSWTPTGACSR
jgi:quercetin dioxygenase-like cupin family protein